jgi:hypothetical protein
VYRIRLSSVSSDTFFANENVFFHNEMFALFFDLPTYIKHDILAQCAEREHNSRLRNRHPETE